MRRPGGPQADASGTAGARSEAQHRGRLFRARGVQVQPRHLGRAGDVQPLEGAALLARNAVGEAAGDSAPTRFSNGIDGEEDRRAACRPTRRSKREECGGQGGRLRRHRAAHRAALPPLPAARRSQLRDGSLARQGDGGAHLSRLQRRARSGHAAAVHRSKARPFTTWGSCTSTSCTRSWARSSPRAAARMRARRCWARFAARLELLLGIGLDYLSFNRRSGTLSGGESQRIRLSTQIGSGLMGMLYVLDEPSIGLHPKDNVKMIATLESLRDIGNTVIVVEHDEDTIRAADHIVEMGPGPGRARRRSGGAGDVRRCAGCARHRRRASSFPGRRAIATPKRRRKGNGKALTVRGARENNLKNVDVDVSAGHAGRDHGRVRFGQEHADQRDPLQGAVEAAGGHAHAAGRARRRRGHGACAQGRQHRPIADRAEQPFESRRPTSASTTTFATCSPQAPLSVERGYKAGRFSFNVKGGRCEECQGEGVITTQLYFMPDVEVTCGACKGARFNSETLDVTVRGKTIDDVLNMSVEEGVAFFAERAGHRQEDRGAERSGAGLSDAGPIGDDALRRRSAAHQDRDGAEQAAAVEAHAVHPRRADDGAASRRCRAAAGVAEPAGRRGPYGAADRASSGRDQDGRSRDRPGSGRRTRGRGSRGDRHAGSRSPRARHRTPAAF